MCLKKTRLRAQNMCIILGVLININEFMTALVITRIFTLVMNKIIRAPEFMRQMDSDVMI